jgi:hypothetical protein
VSGQQAIDLESAAPTAETAPGAAGEPAKSDAKADDGESAPKQAELVIRLVEQHSQLFHDPNETPYAVVRVTDSLRRVFRLRSKPMRSWIARTARQTLGRPVGANVIDEALVALEGIARFDRDERKLHLRVAENDGAIYIDLGDDTGACVEVSAEGWRVMCEPPVLFRRPDAMRPLPRPEPGGTLEDLRPFFNAADDDALHLFVAWMVAAFRPNLPCPVLALHGEQGTAKSTASRVARALVDPNVSPVRSVPRAEDDLAVASHHSHVVAFDNLSGVQPWLSDALCRLATGGGISKRTLYTDDDETVLDAMRPVIVNGIDDLANRADLAERCLVLMLQPIPKSRRRDERTFWRAFETAAPRILGVLLDGVASALHEQAFVPRDDLPRMADFAVWISAAEAGLGLARGALLAAYARNRASVVDVALDAAPVVVALRRLLDVPTHAGHWEGEPSELLEALSRYAPEDTRRSSEWPKSARVLSSALRRQATFLRSVGIKLDLDGKVGHESRRTYRIARVQAPATSPAPSAPSAPAENSHESADGPADGMRTVGTNDAERGASQRSSVARKEQCARCRGQGVVRESSSRDNPRLPSPYVRCPCGRLPSSTGHRLLAEQYGQRARLEELKKEGWPDGGDAAPREGAGQVMGAPPEEASRPSRGAGVTFNRIRFRRGPVHLHAANGWVTLCGSCFDEEDVARDFADGDACRKCERERALLETAAAGDGEDRRHEKPQEASFADGADDADGPAVRPDPETLADWLDDQGTRTAKGNGAQ